MQLLALLAPIGAVLFTVLLALGVCYAIVYTRLCLCFESGRGGCATASAQSVVKSVDMLGTHIEDDYSGTVVTIHDQQHAHQQAVMQFFKAHGYRNHHSYHTFSNPELRVLLLPGVGCMVYTIAAHWGITLVVAAGDPICEPQHDLLMLQTFRNVFPGCMFMDVSKDVATLTAREGAKQPGSPMTVTDMGTETTVHVQNYTFDFNQLRDRLTVWGHASGGGGGGVGVMGYGI